MAILIVYATKNGATEKAAKLLSEKLGGCDIVNISKQSFELSKFDTVIIGSNIRMGTVDKKIRRLMLQYLSVLVNKKVGVFICNCFVENADDYISHNVPPQLYEKLFATASFGGELDINTLHGADRLVAKMVSNSDREKGIVRKFGIDTVAIDTFAKKAASVAADDDGC